MSLERLKKLERETEELKKQLDAINREREIKKIIKDQNKSITPYLFETTKYLFAIIFLLLAKDKAMQVKWIADLIG